MAKEKVEVNDLRKRINELDLQFVKLLDERADLVKGIGNYKKEHNIPVYQPGREKEIQDRILKASKKSFPTDALLHIFTEIVSAGRALEEPTHIGYLGPEGTYSELATRKQFGSSVISHSMPTIPDVFRAVENGKVKYGLVPIENSLEGTVNITLDEFVDSPVQIIGETFLSIHHNLLANVSDISEIKRIYSHPQGFPQCRIWLESHIPNAELVEVSSTAKAASMVPWDKFSAAVASEIAADKYGLNILERNIEDNPENFTRFWIIASEETDPKSREKTTILVSVKDKPGALLRLLSPFQVYDINLSKIESRPSKRRPWDYLFFMDIDESVDHKSVQNALKKIKEDAVFLKIIGSYPKGSV